MTIELTKTQIEALQSGAAHEAGHITIPKTLRGGAARRSSPASSAPSWPPTAPARW